MDHSAALLAFADLALTNSLSVLAMSGQSLLIVDEQHKDTIDDCSATIRLFGSTLVVIMSCSTKSQSHQSWNNPRP